MYITTGYGPCQRFHKVFYEDESLLNTQACSQWIQLEHLETANSIQFNIEQGSAKAPWGNSSCVGCIYASNPQFKSNILQFYLISFKSIVKTSKQPKNIFSIFSVFLLTFIVVLFQFLCTIYCTKVHVFAPASRFDSESRKHLPARWFHPMIWLPNGQGAKGPGKQVYVSETHSCISSLFSIYTHWGGEHRCQCIIYLFISFIVH